MISLPTLNTQRSTILWSTVILLAIANIVAYVDRTNLSVAIASTEFKTYFQLTNEQRGALNSAFFWSYAFLQIPAGAVTDRFGVKIPLAISFIAWSLISAATGWANTLTQLFACRILLGVGESVITPGSLRWIRFNLNERQRGLAVGIFFAGAKLGPAIGAQAAVWLLATHGWRNMFVILGLGGMIWLIPWMLLARNDDRHLESQALQQSVTAPIAFSAIFRTPAIYGILIGTFAYNYFNYFCLTWLPAYFVENWGYRLTRWACLPHSASVAWRSWLSWRGPPPTT